MKVEESKRSFYDSPHTLISEKEAISSSQFIGKFRRIISFLRTKKNNMESQLNNSLRNAIEELRLADKELHRPKEDAVTFCACQCTRTAAIGFLNSFLISNSIRNLKDKSLSRLLKQCSEIDPQFNAVNLSCFECKKMEMNNDGHTYCLSVEKVDECFRVAQSISELVLGKLKTSEKDFA